MKRLLVLFLMLLVATAIFSYFLINSRKQKVTIAKPINNPIIATIENENTQVNESSLTISKSEPALATLPVTSPNVVTPSGSLSQKQKQVAEQLTSLFENGTTEIQYCYTENLDDGRGITAGRAGFTTRDGDAYEVIKKYTQYKADNKLNKYLETLKKLNDNESDSVKGLDGYEKAWRESCNDNLFIKAQDYVVDVMYYNPSQKYADNLGLKLAISRAFLYDTIIQHGDGDDADSIKSIVNKTNTKLGGSPKNGTNEKTWISEFMSIRRSKLARASDESTRDEWAESVGRVDVYKQILNAENYILATPIRINTKEYNEVIN